MMRFLPFLLSVRTGLAALALCLGAPLAWADLTLYPTRIVLEKNQRAAQVELMNNSTTAETYRITLVNRRMSETGEFISIETPGPGDQFADAFLRYSPKQVTVPPGGSQTVRILVRKPADLAPGEYRSHLEFNRVADTTSASSIDQARNPDDKTIGVTLTALVGASMPIIIRHRDTQASVALSDLALVPASASASASAGPALDFQINRSGTRSVYGDLTVTFTPKTGKPVDLAKANALAVYTPNALRRVRMPLQMPPGMTLAAGALSLSYRERPEAGGGVMAEANLTLP